jgi:hypothetical protein
MAGDSRVKIIDALSGIIHSLVQDAELKGEHLDLPALRVILLRRIEDLRGDDESEAANDQPRNLAN